MIEHDALIGEFTHEQRRPREKEALLMLKKIASVVKPIMRQRMWRVGTLSEFYPDDKNLLGLNVGGGEKILVRLRQSYDEKQFVPFEEAVDTMLHELSHIAFGPHNKKFYDLWNQLRDEHEALLAKGYTGEGFLSQGHKLGGRHMPAEELQRRARAAVAEQQQQQENVGHRLGGRGVRRGQDIRSIIARAAQGRRDMLKGCASDSQDDVWKNKITQEVSRNSVITKADKEDANQQAMMQAYIDLVQQEEQERYGKDYVRPSKDNPFGRRGTFDAGPSTLPVPPPVPALSKPSSTPRPAGRADKPTAKGPTRTGEIPSSTSNYSQPWSCPICTLINPPTFLICDACSTERPEPSSSLNSSTVKVGPSAPNPGTEERNKSFHNVQRFEQAAREADFRRPVRWRCHSCGNWMEHQWWTCSSCGTMRRSS